jgi:hypothetical protein
MEKARYKNPWHKPTDQHSGPEFYSTREKPVEHAGHLIYERVDGSVWDVVKDEVCIAQRAGINGAKEAAEESAKWMAAHGYKVGDAVEVAKDFIAGTRNLMGAKGVVDHIFVGSDKASVRVDGKTFAMDGDGVKLDGAAPQATFDELKQRAEELIDEDDDLVYDTAAENGQMVANVKHMYGFKLRVMQAITESEEKFAHLADEVADALQPAARRTSSPSM